MIDSRFTVETLKTLLQGLPNVLVKRFQLELANGVKIEKICPLTREGRVEMEDLPGEDDKMNS